MQHLKVGRRTERYRYDNVLGCPSIELSLGDFQIYTKKLGKVSFVPWLRQVATPNMTASGKVPGFDYWQIYLIQKVAETIFHYTIKTDDFIHSDYKPSQQEDIVFPENEEEFEMLCCNLSLSYMSFKKLCESNGISVC